eukprot:Pgem_evm1s10905
MKFQESHSVQNFIGCFLIVGNRETKNILSRVHRLLYILIIGMNTWATLHLKLHR